MEKVTIFLVLIVTSILLLFRIFSPQFQSFFHYSKLITGVDDFVSIPDDSEEIYFQEILYPDNSEKDFRDDQFNVVVLTKENFTDFVAKNRYVMINFYAPWCYFSRKLSPQYAAAAKMLKDNNSKAVLAKVDSTKEKELARLFKIKSYPTLYFLIDGVQQVLCDPKEGITRDALVFWVNHRVNVGVRNLITMKEADHLLAVKPLMVLGFVESLESPETKELEFASKLHIDVEFYQTTDADVAKLFHIDKQIKPPTLVLLKREDQIRAHFRHEGEFIRSEISSFVSVYKAPSFIKFTFENAADILENPVKQLWLFTSTKSCKVLSTFNVAANALKGKLLFVHVEMGNENSVGHNLAYEFGINENAPRLLAYYNTVEGTEKHIYNGELNLRGIKLFAEEFLQDKLLRKTETSIKTVLRLPSESNIFNSNPSSQSHVN